MSEWQPIETAPKQGRFLIGGNTITGREPWHVEIIKYRDGNSVPMMMDDHFEATHWASFPEPPTKA